jgi:hypothetical protein
MRQAFRQTLTAPQPINKIDGQENNSQRAFLRLGAALHAWLYCGASDE